MERLSCEIGERIASFLGHGERFSCSASGSRNWQRAIEIRTFNDLYSRNADLEIFATICVRQWRLYSAHLIYEMALPIYRNEDCGRHKSERVKLGQKMKRSAR